MDQRISDQYDIFALDLPNKPGRSGEDLFMIFSPLSDSAFCINSEKLECLRRELSDSSLSSGEFHDFILDVREACRSRHGYNLTDTPDRVCYLSISPTAQCNFRCSYCYAEKDHSRQRLETEQMIRVCDRFISRERAAYGALNITFLGGGEPLLESSGMAKAIAFIREKAEGLSIPVRIGLISNMSLLNDSIIDFLVEKDVGVTASFEILQDVQDTQREQYETVSKNLKRFLEKGGNASVRSTITARNVQRQEEMAIELIHSYPEIKCASFEPVTDFSSFRTPLEYRSFIDSFLENFEKAKDRAEKDGVFLNCSFYQRVDVTERRYCPPEWNLTPTGELTVCHRLTGENNSFGCVSPDGTVSIDEEKFRRIVLNDCNETPNCKSCFARWNCAGGCRAQNLAMPRVFKKTACEIFRRFLKRQLVRRLNRFLLENGVGEIPFSCSEGNSYEQ